MAKKAEFDKYILRQTILSTLNDKLRGAPVELSDLLKASTFLCMNEGVADQAETELGLLVREGFVEDRGAAFGEDPFYRITDKGAAQITRMAPELSPFVWGRSAM